MLKPLAAIWFILFLPLQAAAHRAEPPASQPPTGAQVRESQVRAERAILAAYPLDNVDPATLAAVNAFFDSTAEAFVAKEQHQDFPSRTTWRHGQAVTPLLLACEDPLVRLLVHEAERNAWFSIPDNRMVEIEAKLLAVRERGLPEERLAALAASMMFGPTNERKAIIEIAIDATARAMRQPAAGVAEKRRVYNALFRAVMHFGQAQLDELETRIEADPPQDPWLADAVIGSRLANLAWVNRGPLFNFRPRAESLRISAELLARARPRLLAAHEREPACPEPAAMMMSVIIIAQDLPGEHSRDWFARVEAVQPDFRPAFRRMRVALLEQWGGEPEELRQFALRCARPELRATDAPIEAVQALRVLASEIGVDRVWSDAELTGTVRSALESCLAANPPPERAEEARHALIYLLDAIDDKPAAAAVLRDAGGEIDFWLRRIWNRQHLPYAPRLLAYDTPARPFARLADTAESIDDWASAAEFWASASDLIDPDADPLAHAAVAERVLAADRAGRLATREWLDLGFTNGLSGFCVLQGEFEPLSPTQVRLYREKWYFHRTAVGVFDLPVTGHYEIEATVRTGFSKAGIIVGLRPVKPRNEGYTRIAVRQDELHIEYSYKAPARKIAIDAPYGQPVRLRVVVNGTALAVFVNDKPVYEGEAPSERIAWGSRVGIAGEPSSTMGERAEPSTVSDFRVRLIAPAQRPAADQPEQDDGDLWLF